MADPVDLEIAEILYESGAVKFRYARVLSPDRTRWIRHGLFVAYDETGAAVLQGQYVEGKEEGLWRDFYPDGQPAAEGRYQKGLEVGVWRHWNSDGTEEPSTNHG
jgi:hypothetical protein